MIKLQTGIMNLPALPSQHLLQQQASWLAPARARLLRRTGIAHRRPILDLGAGYGAVTGELVRRGSGLVVALDRETAALPKSAHNECVNGDALRLPFADETFDLVFCQCVLLWVGDVETAVAEIYRVLQPGGILIALEPDYAGMIEYPPEIATRDLWLAALTRAGAEPEIGRQLPGLLTQTDFQVELNLLNKVLPASPTRFDFLQTLPLAETERSRLNQCANFSDQLTERWAQIAHLPFFLISATKGGG
ncbi:MAG: class I SAM-dependent methyltransferase [Chloroflexi bacterium]|nr:class I SAM-dependent methyltransferase [Chloroflexota bacterium]